LKERFPWLVCNGSRKIKKVKIVLKNNQTSYRYHKLLKPANIFNETFIPKLNKRILDNNALLKANKVKHRIFLHLHFNKKHRFIF